MKEKIAIVTDSSSSLDFIGYDDYSNIFLVRMPIYINNEEYIDGKTITTEDFYNRIQSENIIPSTSQPPLGKTLELYEKLRDEGYTDIIHYSISKGISGAYQALFSISQAVDGIRVHLPDTKSTALFLGYIVLKAAQMVKDNKSVEEVLKYSDYLTSHYHVYFMVDDLKYLIKNGRLSNAAGFIGSVLKIKPILTFNDEGEIIGIEKIRTTKKGMNHIINTIIEEAKQYKKVDYFVAYGGDQNLAQKFKETVSQKINMNEALISILPSVIGAHVGSGVIGFGFFVVEK